MKFYCVASKEVRKSMLDSVVLMINKEISARTHAPLGNLTLLLENG